MCGKTFNAPLKTENVSSEKEHVYEACPYCLTEITEETGPILIEERSIHETYEPEEQRESAKPALDEEPFSPPTISAPNATKCVHEVGYLSRRPRKEGIPEECLTCENIVPCMLQNVTR